MGVERRRATTRVAPTRGLSGPIFIPTLISVTTDTSNDENGVGGDGLAWQMAGAWIPAFAGMTVGVVVVRGGFQTRPTKSWSRYPSMLGCWSTRVPRTGRSLATAANVQ